VGEHGGGEVPREAVSLRAAKPRPALPAKAGMKLFQMAVDGVQEFLGHLGRPLPLLGRRKYSCSELPPLVGLSLAGGGRPLQFTLLLTPLNAGLSLPGARGHVVTVAGILSCRLDPDGLELHRIGSDGEGLPGGRIIVGEVIQPV